jgi:hypothetical protein
MQAESVKKPCESGSYLNGTVALSGIPFVQAGRSSAQGMQVAEPIPAKASVSKPFICHPGMLSVWHRTLFVRGRRLEAAAAEPGAMSVKPFRNHYSLTGLDWTGLDWTGLSGLLR